MGRGMASGIGAGVGMGTGIGRAIEGYIPPAGCCGGWPAILALWTPEFFSFLFEMCFVSEIHLCISGTVMDKAELPKAVLVVGGTGGVGRHVVRILLERRTFQSVKVRVLTRMPERARTLLSGATHCEVGIEGDVGDRLEVVEGDLAQNRGLIEATQGIDAIICARFSEKTQKSENGG